MGVRAVFATSSGFVHLYSLRFKEKEKRAAVVAKAAVHKQGSVQRFKFAGRLEFSVGQWVIQNVPLATELGISLIILPLMRILQRNLKRTYLIV